MEWKYIKQLKDKENIREIEIKYNIELPSALKELILSCNGGRPKRNIFNTKNNKEKVMKLLLSYNKDDKENIYSYSDLFYKGYIPFGITEFGDVICINPLNYSIEIYLHELDTFEYICENIETFFKILYEDK